MADTDIVRIQASYRQALSRSHALGFAIARDFWSVQFEFAVAWLRSLGTVDDAAKPSPDRVPGLGVWGEAPIGTPPPT